MHADEEIGSQRMPSETAHERMPSSAMGCKRMPSSASLAFFRRGPSPSFRAIALSLASVALCAFLFGDPSFLTPSRGAGRLPEPKSNGPENPPSFVRDIMPIFMRFGCNAGGCHGAAQGKNGFRLSLFGYDPAADWQRLTRESRARRISLDDPPQSLVLAKATGAVPHKGGVRFKKDSAAYATLLSWIGAGAPLDEKPPEIKDLLLAPPTAEFVGQGGRIAARLEAHWSDDVRVDAGPAAIWSTSNDAVATVDAEGVVVAVGPGEAVVMARYGSRAATMRVLVRSENPAPWPDRPQTGPIDRIIDRKLQTLGFAPSEIADDAAFLRRATLDITGRLPTVDEVHAFGSSSSPTKRRELVDRLLARPEWSDVFALPWIETMRIESLKLTRKGVESFTDYWRDELRKGRPFDQLVKEILTAGGGHYENPAVDLYLVDSDPKGLAELTAQVFMGVRIQCAQCHNHPFERWTMDDYYGFAAFFARVASKPSDDPRERIVYERRDGDVRHPKDQRVMPPRFLGGPIADVPQTKERRAALAEWLTADDNPFFAANVANRLFARFFGRGVIDPVDDVRVSNPPSHPELLKHLEKRLIETRYDLKEIVREITASRAYQAAPSAPHIPSQFFAGSIVRRLGAEELHEAIVSVTGVPTKFVGLEMGETAFDVVDGDSSSYFLDLFGRPRRTSACTCDRRDDPTLGQALHLINGATITEKLRAPNGHLARLIDEKKTNTEIIGYVYEAALARPPEAAELEHLLAEVDAAKDRRACLEDIWWAVMNSDEFTFIH